MFPGQNSPYTGVLRELCAVSPAAREHLAQCDALLREFRLPSFATMAWSDFASPEADLWRSQLVTVLSSSVYAHVLAAAGNRGKRQHVRGTAAARRVFARYSS
jgi:hypothetical protein